MTPAWNWKGQTLLEMWGLNVCGTEVTAYYFWLQRYEPIEDEL